MDDPHFRVLFEASPGLTLALLPDAPRFTITGVNDAYVRATTVQRSEVLGRGLFDVFRDDPHDPRAEGVRNLRASLARVIDTGVADVLAVQTFDVPRLPEQGGGFDERWWSPVISPALGADGHIAYILLRVEDVTEFVRLKQHGIEQDKLSEGMRAHGVSMEAELFLRAREIQQVSERLHGANAEISRLLERTRELDKLKTQFFANVSHELRTPLTLILGPAQRLLADATGADEKRDLQVILRNARTLLRHVNDLFDITRFEEARLAPTYVETDLAALARLVAAHFESVAVERGIDWRVELPATLPVQVDPSMVARVLFNLLANAFKFSPPGTCVRLGLASDGDLVRFEVTDGGPGIAPQWRDAVFERFRQLDTPETRLQGGGGLGLAIARDLVQLHHGRICIDDAPEGGACFVVELPRSAPAGTAVAARALSTWTGTDGGIATVADTASVIELLRPPATLPAPPRTGTGALLLVIEDDRDLSAFMHDSLSDDYRVATAFDGQQGLRDALALKPDLIITDVMMPGLDGEALVQALRTHHEFDETPVIVVSARAEDALRVRLLRNGAQDYLTKPFVVEDLQVRVSVLLARKQALAVLRRREEYWHGLFEQATESIVIVGPDNACTDANEAACRLLGRPREQLVGTNFDTFLAPDEHQRGALEACRVGAGGVVQRQEWTLVRGDGRAVPADVTVRRLSDNHCLVMLVDASERHRREQVAQHASDELERHVAERTAQLRWLAAELEAAEMRERRQLARDLHDDLGQTLAAAQIRLGALHRHPQADVREAAEEVAAIIAEANRATRSLAAQLAPAVLYELGLAAALEWLGEQVHEQFGLVVTINDEGGPKVLSEEAGSIIFRAVRELLINVAKHAGVRAAEVMLERRGDQLCVEVRDAGTGLSANPKASLRSGLGLASVRERLSFIGGRFEIRSIPGDGTVAMLHVPLQTATALAATPPRDEEGIR